MMQMLVLRRSPAHRVGLSEAERDANEGGDSPQGSIPRTEKGPSSDVPNIRWLLALITTIHRFIYLASGGWVGRFLSFRKRALLLTHTGRKSGKTYVVPLLYIEDGPRFIVVGSNAGDPREPQWWQNLKSHPRARVQVGRQKQAVQARKASDEEARQLWPRLEQAYHSFPRYRERSGRDIPIVVLDPNAG